MGWRGRYESPDRVEDARKAEEMFKEPRLSDEEVRELPIEELRSRFKRGAFPITTSWEDVLRIRGEV